MALAGVKRSNDAIRGENLKRKHKKAKTQKEYHSSSEEDGVQLPQLSSEKRRKLHGERITKSDSNIGVINSKTKRTGPENEEQKNNEEISDVATGELSESSYSSDGDVQAGAENDDADINTDKPATSRTPKRNDPNAFATSMAKILDSKLSNSKRADPVLARSQTALAASREITELKLEAKAKQKIRAEKKEILEKGRVRDVLGLSDKSPVTAEAVAQDEKRLKKIAQRGVIKLFNAVRAAQVKGEEAAREVRKEGVVGMKHREGRVNEMSKRGFLDLIASGGKKTDLS